MSIAVQEQAAAPTLPPVGETILYDFYQSFYFSQGNATAQRDIIEGVVDFYADTFSEPQTSQAIALLPELGKRALALIPPSRHKNLNISYDDEILEEAELEGVSVIELDFLKMWRPMQRAITAIPDRSPSAKQHLTKQKIANIAGTVAGRDLTYQLDRKRPGRKPGQDVHESLFRLHVILERPTGSEAFDTIMKQARDILHEGYPRNLRKKVSELAVAWTAKHPGQSFSSDT